MVLYRCECGVESDNRYNMKKHLIRKTSCIKGKDMSVIDVDFLCVSRITKDLSILTSDEKKQRQKEQIKQHDFNRGILGNLTDLTYAKEKLKSMKKASKERKHILPTFWSSETVLSLLQKNQIYKVDTNIGIFEFPTILANGYLNSAVLDRINDDIGYKLDNIEVRPHFLNTPYKLSTDDIKQIPILREIPRTLDELEEIEYMINMQPLHKNFFYNKAHDIMKNTKIKTREKRGITFDFESIEECRQFLVEQYVKQGGRCYYTNIPIVQDKEDIFMISTERLDPTKSYNKNNIVFVVIGLNFPPKGQIYNKQINEEQLKIAIDAAIFNQEYWDRCTLLTSERKKKCEEAKEHDRKILKELLFL
jgi:hypothetical protein